MTKTEIRQRRKQFEEQVKHAYARYYSDGQEQTRLESELPQAQLALRNARTASAKGVAADVDGAVARLDELTASIHTLKTESFGKLAWDEAREELTAFLREHFDVFAEDAAKLSEAAEEGLQKANRAVMLAGDKWREARTAWQPLCAAVSIGQVPAFPLVGGENIAARPPSLELDEEVEAA
jgi:hypothetical protein